MNSIDDYQNSYNYQLDLQKSLTGSAITIDFEKLDEKSKGELIDTLNRFFIKRRSEIYNNVLAGVHQDL